MQITINDVQVEKVSKGRSNYEVANISYTHNGEAKERKIMSFANPQVFKDVQGYVGREVEVTVTKNGQYMEWSAITLVNNTKSEGGSAPVVKVAGSNYETKEERAARQVLIVKQSSLSTAVEMLKPGAKTALDAGEVKKIAQELTDWVFSQE